MTKEQAIQEIKERIEEIRPYGTHANEAIYELQVGMKWIEKAHVWVDGELSGPHLACAIGSHILYRTPFLHPQIRTLWELNQ